ncbi:hypothetical protein [Helicobacter sp. 11S02596-1]|uniref:hypothetical protein n=1 Tax=Helicobacter sp. 11S02596-1 TaxID=1476194 RepID=UPI000BA7D99E|nr:hypothetical protein [Helicobacter sp. 11S02596-1]PAF44019.1 hypothetical protein BJI48_04340 [Helicobacter sp. 11S02596-1]
MNLAMKQTEMANRAQRADEIAPGMTYDELLDAIDNGIGVRVRLLREGHNAIYYDEAVSSQYNLLLKPDGKCYFLDPDNQSREIKILRELNPQEYAKIDLIKGRDY